MTEIINADMRTLGWRINDYTSKDWDEYQPPELEWLTMASNEVALFAGGQEWYKTDTTVDVKR